MIVDRLPSVEPPDDGPDRNIWDRTIAHATIPDRGLRTSLAANSMMALTRGARPGGFDVPLPRFSLIIRHGGGEFNSRTGRLT